MVLEHEAEFNVALEMAMDAGLTAYLRSYAEERELLIRKLRHRMRLYEEATEIVCHSIGLDGMPLLIKKEWRNLMTEKEYVE